MGAVQLDKALAIKSAIASAAMLAGFLAGVPVVIAALVPAAIMLASTKTESEKLFSGVDFNLLVFFAGLFIITDATSRTAAFAWIERSVLVLSPLAAGAADPASSWLILAMVSTFAGNLTLLGSVANLIVAEGAASRGAKLGFWDYLKAGVPITILTLVVGTVWLYLTA
jgi:Na+/H+ antiporter NhaD/arsenite permease-like protein